VVKCAVKPWLVPALPLGILRTVAGATSATGAEAKTILGGAYYGMDVQISLLAN